MICPECGYVMSAFDKDCPRCQNFRERGLDVAPVAQLPPPQEVVVVAVAAAPEPSPAAAPLPVAEPEPPIVPLAQQPIFASDLFRCPVCGHQDTRKVSAIVQEGSWVEHSTGSVGTSGQVWEGGMYLSQSSVSQRTVGASHLAQALAPPPQPSHPEPDGGKLFGGIVLILFGGWMLLSQIPFLCFVAACLIGCGVVPAFKYAGAIEDRNRAVAMFPYWRGQMAKWDRLFYCRRCDSVFNPLTVQSAPVSQIRGLLV